MVGVATAFAQKLQLLGRFHPLGQHLHAQAVAHGDDGRADGHVVAVVRNIADEALVDLQHIDRVTLEGRERGIACTKVIHCHAQAQLLQTQQHLARFVRTLSQGGFGQFKLQAARRKTTELQGTRGAARQIGQVELAR